MTDLAIGHAALIARAARYLDDWAAEWAQRWPDDTLTPLGMGDLAIDLRELLPDTDPGRTLAWPEQDHEPVSGVDYLPTDDVEDFDRNWVEPTTTDGGHDGYPIAGSLTDARADCAACAAVGAAVEAEWVGWPNSVLRRAA